MSFKLVGKKSREAATGVARRGDDPSAYTTTVAATQLPATARTPTPALRIGVIVAEQEASEQSRNTEGNRESAKRPWRGVS
jgi:hypothetical protein